MSSRSLVLPFFPTPPQEYSQEYLVELVRSFSVHLNQYQNPGDSRHTNLTLTNLPEDDTGLETGAIFEHNGYVKIARAFEAHVRGSGAIGAVGTVTVTIS